jgi:hypothetical protein
MDGARFFLAELWRTLWSTEQRKVQILVAGVAMLASASIGAVYADMPFIDIYPIILWLLSIGICFGMLYPARGPRLMRFDRAWIWLAMLFVVALFLRVLNLKNLPPGFHIDETGTADFALRHVFHPSIPGQTINPFRTGTDSQPVLYSYLLFFTMKLAGFTVVGARLSSVLAGGVGCPGGIFGRE